MEKIEIYAFDGEGYMPLIEYNSWRVAVANYCDRLHEENLCKMERHLETDEVFILLNGEATLYLGKNMKKHSMKKGKVYNVKCGEWHCISMSQTGKVAIIENSNTGEKNTEYYYFKEGINV